jgi:hypothetical protein
MVQWAVALLTLVLAAGLFARLHRLMVQSSWAATGKRGGAMIVAAWFTYLGVALLVGGLLQASIGLLPGAPR